MVLLEIDNVSKTYEGETESDAIKAVDVLSIDVNRGEFLSLIGPTGCGKTTLLKMIAGLIKPSQGSIRINGMEVSSPSEDVGFVFQKDSTLPWRNVFENVVFGLEMKGIPEEERTRRSQEMIDLVGLSGFEDNYPNELSGGMRQRVAIARALTLNPSIMIMDEPFGALDEQTRRILGDELLRICRETDQTTLFVTHSISEAIHLSDRIGVITSRPGRIKELVDIDIPRPRTAELLNSNKFNEIRNEIWELLKIEAERGMMNY